MVKKMNLSILLTSLLILTGILSYLQWGRQMYVYNSSGSGSDSNYELHISVTLNTLVVIDQQKCAEKIFKYCRNNAFHNVHFSYDLQIPQALFVTVYKNTKDAEIGKPIFTFSYLQENRINGTYNIVDNPQDFTLKLN